MWGSQKLNTKNFRLRYFSPSIWIGLNCILSPFLPVVDHYNGGNAYSSGFCAVVFLFVAPVPSWKLPSFAAFLFPSSDEPITSLIHNKKLITWFRWKRKLKEGESYFIVKVKQYDEMVENVFLSFIFILMLKNINLKFQWLYLYFPQYKLFLKHEWWCKKISFMFPFKTM